MNFARVALDVPVSTLFDYRAQAVTRADVGRRVLVPFGRKIAVGVIIELARTTWREAAAPTHRASRARRHCQ